MSRGQVVVAHGDTKRYLELPFNICGDPETLRHIAQTILDKCDANAFSYGWVRILTLEAEQKSIADMTPLPWEERARG